MKKLATFDYADTYIDSVEAFVKTVEVIRIDFHATYLNIWYK